MLTCVYLAYMTQCHCKSENATLHDTCSSITLHNNNFNNDTRLSLLVTATAVEQRLLVVMMSRTVFILVTVECIDLNTYHLS